ncbi:MAG: hypothetical protein ACRDAU_07225 [Clostridium sp.]
MQKNIEFKQKLYKKKVLSNNIFNFKFLIKNLSFNIIQDLRFKQELTMKSIKKNFNIKKNEEVIFVKKNGDELILGDLEPNEVIEIEIEIENISFHLEESLSRGVLKYHFNNIQIFDESNIETIKFYSADFKENGIFNINFDKEYIGLDEEIQMDINIENKGNLIAERVCIGNLIHPNLEYIDNTFTINNEMVLFKHNLNSIELGMLIPNQKIEIKLKVKLRENISSEYIQHAVSLKFENVIDRKVYKETIRSNELTMFTKIIRLDNFEKIFNVEKVALNELVSVKVKGTNTGNINIYNMRIIDSGLSKFRVLKNTLKLNGHYLNFFDLDYGIMIEELKVKEAFILEYDAIILEPDLNSKILAMIDMNYKNMQIKKQFIGINKNPEIMIPDLTQCKKERNKNLVFLEDEILNKITLKNTGNIKCEKLIIENNLEEGIKFIPNTLTIKNEKVYSNNAENIIVDYLDINEVKEITYLTKATNLGRLKETKTNIKYQYNINSKNYYNKFTIYDKEIFILGGEISTIQKCIDKTHALLEEEINFLIVLKNTGNIPCKKVFIKERETFYLDFIENSLIINGEKLEFDIFKGFLYGDLNINESIEIKFKCKAKKVSVKPIQSITVVNYMYGSEATIRETSLVCPSEYFIVESPIMDIKLDIFKDSILSGEKMPIRIFLKNIGNLNAYNVLFKNLYSSEIEIIKDSIKINRKKYILTEPIFNLGKVEIGQEVEIFYYIKINNANIDKGILTSEIEYEFYKSKTQEKLKFLKQVDPLSFIIINPSIVISENVDKKTLEKGDVINYSLYLNNNGTQDLYNLKLNLDGIVSSDLSIIEFTINNNLTKINNINEIDIKKLFKKESLLINIKLKLLEIKQENTLEIRATIKGNYKLNENREFEFSKVSQGIRIRTESNLILIKKECEKSIYLKGEEISYLVTIRNEGTSIAENIFYYDKTMIEGFIKGTLSINGEIIKSSIVTGIFLGQLKQGKSIFIRYISKYDKCFEKDELVEQSKLSCEFFNSDLGYIKREFLSNQFKIKLLEENLKVMKISNKENISNGENIKLTTTLENNGNIILENLKFKEIIPKGFLLMDDRVFMNNHKVINISKDVEIFIAKLSPNEIIEITTEYLYMNYKNIRLLFTESLVEYNYKIENNYIENKILSNKVNFKNSITTFKNFTINHNIYLKADEVWISEITDAIVIAKIIKTYVVNTINATSLGRETFTGYKMMIRGVLEEKIEYIANTEQETIHMILNKELFSTNLILPKGYDKNDDLRIEPVIHKVLFRKIDEKTMNISINLTIQGLF